MTNTKRGAMQEVLLRDVKYVVAFFTDTDMFLRHQSMRSKDELSQFIARPDVQTWAVFERVIVESQS